MKKDPDGPKKEGNGHQDDEIVIVCLPVVTGPAIPGSTQRNCARCATPVWVSPATLQSVPHAPQRRFVCMECAVKEEDFDESLQPPTPQQIDELRRYLEQRESEETP